jgi:hypothetical protein
MRNTADVTGGEPIAVWLHSILGVSAVNPAVAFYDIQGRKREVLFIYFVPDTTRDFMKIYYLKLNNNSKIFIVVINGTVLIVNWIHTYSSHFITKGVS